MLYSDNLSQFELIVRANTQGIGDYRPVCFPQRYYVAATEYWKAYNDAVKHGSNSPFLDAAKHMKEHGATQEQLNCHDFQEALHQLKYLRKL